MDDAENYKKVLAECYTKILRDLGPTPLLDRMVENNFLPDITVRDIQEERRTTDKNRAIVDRVRTSGPKGYQKFKEMLKTSGNEFVYDMLKEKEEEIAKREIYIIAIGYDQDSKSKLLNAMTREKSVFTSFGCRRNLDIKKIKHYTIHGYGIRLVLTPSLNSPAWKKVKEQLLIEKKWTERHLVFVYVRAADATHADDTFALNNVKDAFPNEHVLGVDCYSIKAKKETFSLSGDKEHSFDEKFPYRFRTDDNWSSRAKKGMEILEQIAEAAFPTPNSRVEAEEGPSEGETEKASYSTQDDSLKADATMLNLMPTVDVETEFKPKLKEKLTQEDREMFMTALRCGSARSNHVRVNVVGNHGVGKTTVIKRLLMEKIVCPNVPKPTENLEIHWLTARCSEKEGTKSWETEATEQFLEDLNVQRMAQAMEQTMKSLKHTSSIESSFSNLSSMSSQPDSLQVENQDNKYPVHYTSLHADFADPFGGSEECADDTSCSSVTTRQKLWGSNPMSLLRYKEDYLKRVLNHIELLKKKKREHMYVSYWDFAGQSTYYATHQLFLSPSAVYLLVVDLRKDLSETIEDNLDFSSGVLQSCTVADALKFWVHSIQAYTKDEHGGHAPFIVVGTHRGDIKDDDEVQRKFKAIRDLLKTNVECIAIDNTLAPETEENLSQLRNRIIDVGLGVIDEKVPSQWIDLEWYLQIRTDCRGGYITFEKLQELDKQLDLPMLNLDRLEGFLCHQHYRGNLLFYQQEDLKDIIITDPMILVKFLNCLLRRPDTPVCYHTSGWNEEGLLNHKYIEEVRKKLDIDESACIMLLKILVKQHILHPLKASSTAGKEDQYFMPCLLKDKPQEEETIPDDCSYSPMFQIRFDHDSLYQTTYHQIVCAIMKSIPVIEDEEKKLIYNLHASLDVDGNKAVWLELSWKKCRMNFRIKDFRKGRMKLMSQYVEDMIDKQLKQAIEDVLSVNQHINVSYEFWVACPNPTHEGSFVQLKLLREKKEGFCSGVAGVGGRHMVMLEEIPVIAGSKRDQQKEDPIMREKPNDIMLGRLAWKLKTLRKETASTLALRLNLPNAFTTADVVTRDYDDPGTELFHILHFWRNYRTTDRSCSFLLNRLTRTKDYDHSTLKTAMLTPECKDTKFETIPEWASRDNQDITIISDHIGAGYTFMLLEVGVQWTDIQLERRNYRDDTRGMVRHLLGSRRRCAKSGLPTREILEAAKLFENPVETIMDKLQTLHT